MSEHATEGLCERLAEVIDSAHNPLEPFAAGLLAAAVLEYLSQLCDPGDLPARMAEAIHASECGCPDGYDKWHMQLAQAAMSVRWEVYIQQAAEAWQQTQLAWHVEAELSSRRDHETRWGLERQKREEAERVLDAALQDAEQLRAGLDEARDDREKLYEAKKELFHRFGKVVAERDALQAAITKLKSAHAHACPLVQGALSSPPFSCSSCATFAALDASTGTTGTIGDHYIHVTYGPWESSGHQCGDLIVDGCDEPVPSRLVTVHDHLGGERVIGSELGECPNRCHAAALDAPETPEETT